MGERSEHEPGVTKPMKVPSIWALLLRSSEQYGDHAAWRELGAAVTYKDLRTRAESVARFLEGQGLVPGDPISILSENSANYLTSYFAAAGAELILNPLNTRLALAELVEIIRDSGSRFLFAEQSSRELAGALVEQTELEGILWLDGDARAESEFRWSDVLGVVGDPIGPPALGGDEPAQIYYTSGTTGKPKGVVLTHRNVVRHAESAVRELDLNAGDTWGHFAPMFHLADAWACFAVTLVGGTHAFVPRFDAAATLRCMVAESVTCTNLVPTMIVRLLAEQKSDRRELPDLRLILSGGAPLAPTLIDELGRFIGCEYAQTYGLTETSPYLTISRLGAESEALTAEERRSRNARTGRVFEGVELEVVDEGGAPVRPDDLAVGEIRVRGETISPGYWRQPEETALAFREGWFYTGDLAVVDAAGWINIVDRKKDVIISGGETVYSTEVENALFRLDAIEEAAVFCLPDAKWGERVAAAIVLREGSTLDETEVEEHCRELLAGYKRPREIHFVESLPKTGSGKIQKQALRVRFMSDS